MSKLTELQEQHKAYVEAEKAAEPLRPKVLEVVYKKCTDGDRYDGVFEYWPIDDVIKIIPKRYDYRNSTLVDSADIPALIKALSDFIE
jgi:hypothetical protein